MRWRVKRLCADCPFAKAGPGARLRRSLHPERWREITESLLRGDHFFCHRTTVETGDGSKLVCAGSIKWQARRGVTAQFVQIAERLDWLKKKLNA